MRRRRPIFSSCRLRARRMSAPRRRRTNDFRSGPRVGAVRDSRTARPVVSSTRSIHARSGIATASMTWRAFADGSITDDSDAAIAAVDRIDALDRRKISEDVARRFSVRRMADEYVALTSACWRKLRERPLAANVYHITHLLTCRLSHGESGDAASIIAIVGVSPASSRARRAANRHFPPAPSTRPFASASPARALRDRRRQHAPAETCYPAAFPLP